MPLALSRHGSSRSIPSRFAPRASLPLLMLLVAMALGAASSAQAQPVFSKAFAPDTIGPGSTSALLFEIDNGAGVPVTDLAFVLNLPAGVNLAIPALPETTCVDGLVVAPDGGTTISLSGGELAAFETCVVTVQVTASAPGSYTSVTGDLTSSQGNSGLAADDLVVETDRPGFTKSFSPASVPFGGRTTLTFTIDNSLTANQFLGMGFLDPLPTGLTIAEPSNVSSTCNGGSLTALPGADVFAYAPAFFGDASVAAGATCTLTVDVLAAINLGGVEPIVNVSGDLTGSSAGPLRNSGFATAALDTVVTDNIILIEEFLNDPVLPGAPVDVRYTIQNIDRDFPLTGGSFSSDLSAILGGLSAIGTPLNDVCGPGSSLSGMSVLTLTGATLPPEGTCTFDVSLQVPAGAAAGAYGSSTTALSGTIDGLLVTSEAPRDVLFVSDAPRLSKVFLADPVGAGEVFAMEFTISNPSATEAATEISFSDNLTAFIDGVQATTVPPVGFCGAGSAAFVFTSLNSSIFSVDGANLPPGGSCTFSVDLLAPVDARSQTATNITSMLSSTVAGATQLTASASDVVTVIGGPRLDMSFTPGAVAPGDIVDLEFTLTLDEDVPGDATAIAFNDDLSAALAGLSAVDLPINDVCGAGSQLSGTTNLTLTGASLQPGQSCSFSTTLQVPAGASPGSYVNNSSPVTSINSGVMATGPATATTLTVSGLEFSLEFIDDPALPGGTVTARYTIDNTSPADTTGLVFTHDIDAQLPGLAAPGPLPANPCGAGSSLTGTNFLIFTGGNLLAGTSCSFDVLLDVPPGAGDGQYSSATGNLVGQVGGNNVTVPPANDAFIVNGSLLFLEHAYVNDPVAPGGAVTLEYTLSNLDGSNLASGLTFSHDLSAVLPGLTAVALPANDVCGIGSQISGAGLLTLTGASLPAAGDCTFQVDVVAPAAALAGTYASTTSSVSGTISGLAVSAPPSSAELQIQSFEFSKVFSNSPVDISTGPAVATLQFDITNNGSVPAGDLAFSDDLDAALSGLVAINLPQFDICGPGSTLSGTSVITFSGGNLAASASCSFSVDVQTPANAIGGTYTNTTSELSVVGLPAAEPAVADLVLVGAAQLAILPALLDFGDQRLGTSSGELTVTVENQGNDVLSIFSIPAVSAPFALSVGTCPAAPFDLVPAAQCTLSYQFTPTTLGPESETVTIASNAPDTSAFDLQGTGVQPGLVISPGTLAFGDQLINTGSGVLTATLSSSGTEAVIVTAVTPPTGDFVELSSNCEALPFTLAIGESCSIDYQFLPTSTGPSLTTISVTSDAPSSIDTFDLTGNGTEAILDLSASAINFPDTNLLAAASTEVLSLSNTGDGPLTITAITDPGAPFSTSGGSCSAIPVLLAPSSSCTLELSFDPDVLGAASSSFDLLSNSASSPDTVSVTGLGVQAVLSLGAASVAFPDTVVGQTVTETLQLENTGNIDVSVSLNDDPGAPFAVQPGTCGSSSFILTPAGTCELDIEFAPSAPGSFSGDFELENDSGDGPPIVALTGLGLQGELSLDTADLDFSVTALGETSVLDVTVTNSGNAAVTVTDLNGPGAPFAIQSSTCGATPFSLAASAACTLTVSFAPTSSGQFIDAIELIHDGVNSPTTIGLSGSLQTILPVPVNSRFGLILLALLMVAWAGFGLRRDP